MKNTVDREMRVLGIVAGAACTIALIALCCTVGCGTMRKADDPVVLDMEPVSSFVQRTTNQIYNVETVLVMAGETLLAARQHVSNEDWEKVALASNKAHAAFQAARTALTSMELGAGDRLAVDKALTAMHAAVSEFLRVKEEVT